MYSRKREEFVADFYIVARRVLTDVEFKIFRWVFLLGADWSLCVRYLGVDRGNHFHVVYRIEEKLGREFADMKPYPLYPLDEYFGGNVRAKPIPRFPPYRMRRGKSPQRLPLTA